MAERTAIDAEIRNSTNDLQAAKRALESGLTPFPGEIQGTAGPYTMLSAQYWQRGRALEYAVEDARERLDDAYAARNAPNSANAARSHRAREDCGRTTGSHLSQQAPPPKDKFAQRGPAHYMMGVDALARSRARSRPRGIAAGAPPEARLVTRAPVHRAPR